MTVRKCDQWPSGAGTPSRLKRWKVTISFSEKVYVARFSQRFSVMMVDHGVG